jgi:dTDP-4-amino-4,6-dideoxygalactose transaminase
MPGNNYRMTDLQAAIGLPQLATYEAKINARQRNAQRLNDLLSPVPWLTTPTEVAGRRHVWHQYTLLLHDDAPLQRDQLIEHLARRGVTAAAYYPRLVHEYDCFRERRDVVVDPTPRAALAARSCLSLPVHPRLTDADLEQIAGAVRSAEASA